MAYDDAGTWWPDTPQLDEGGNVMWKPTVDDAGTPLPAPAAPPARIGRQSLLPVPSGWSWDGEQLFGPGGNVASIYGNSLTNGEPTFVVWKPEDLPPEIVSAMKSSGIPVVGPGSELHTKMLTPEGGGDFIDKIINGVDKFMPEDLGGAVLLFASLFGIPAVMAGGGAAAASLESAGAFGGEALGAAANSAGAFGGSVAPWTAGAGGLTATGATNMDLGDWWDWGSTSGTSSDLVTPDWLEGLLKETGEFGIDPASLEGGFNSALSGTDWMSGVKSVAEELTKKVGGDAAKGLLSKLFSGDASVLDTIKSFGIPAALIAGLFEDNSSPLTGTLTDAANKAVSSAGAFAAMPSVGMQPSSQKAIDLANSSAGAWQPYVDKAATYTDKAAGGIPSIDLSTYMNPYLDSVLSPAIRDIEEAAAKRRQQMKHLADVSGNDTYIPGSTESTRYGVESGLIDRDTLRAIGDVSANARKGAFDTATGLASTDLNRTGAAGGAFNTLANTVGTQGAKDFTTLGAAGELEAKPQENALTKAADTAKLYTSVIPGTASAATATKSPSILGQAVGAFGAYNAANKAGLL